MIKQTKYNIAETNIANLGSDLEKKVREAAAHNEPAWKNAGQKTGLLIWRIEKFNVKTWPQNQYGQFYDGDSYIVLNTYQKAGENVLKHDAHFWLGDNTTQDEAGTAAYKTVELDDFLHGAPIEHREVQGFESALFLSYFKTPIHVLQGGVESGFRHVKPEEYKPRLLQIKGKKKVRVTQVPLSRDSLNSGDVFILDTGVLIFVWIGREVGVMEKSKGMQVSEAIEDDRDGRASTVTLNEGDHDERFWSHLGGEGHIKSAAEGGSDVEAPHGPKRVVKISDRTGSPVFDEVSTGAIKRDALHSDDVFIVDSGEEVYAWVGTGASAGEKKNTLDYATKYLRDSKLPEWTPVTTIIEGKESSAFKRLFA